MARKRIENIIIENAKIIFRNFSGKETVYNRAGNRNFCVIIPDPEQAQVLAADGWNIKNLSPRDGDDEETAYLQVAVNFDNIPPKITMVTKNADVKLDANSVGTLDYTEIENADLIIRPYSWEVNGKTGVKAYLQTMYVTIREDPFAAKYARPDVRQDMAIQKEEEMRQAKTLKGFMDRVNQRNVEQQVPADPKDLPFEI